MKVSDLVWQLRQQGVKLKLDGEQLHVSLPEGGIDNALKASLIAQKEAVKDYIRSLSNNRPALGDYAISASGKTEAPLSFAQKRLWFIEQLGDSGGQYHIPVPLAVFGRFDEAVAERAFNAVIARHSALRTRIVTNDEVQLQQVTQDQDFTLARFDLTDVNDTERQARLTSLLSELAMAPFDLTQGLMMRGAFIRLAPDCADTSVQVGVLMIVIHHIAFDGWSSALLAGDFTTLYQRFLHGKSNPLQPLPISYIDYSLWQQRWFEGPKMPEQLRYWQQQLAGMPQLHSLPLDFARPKRRAGIGGLVLTQLRGEVVSNLSALAKKLHITPFILLHGALALLLSKHSNNKDIVIGTPVANRATTELEALVGFFVNTLVLRVDTNKAALGDYFAHVRQVNHDALVNQDLPFDYLVEQLDVVRTQAVTPLFQVMFAMNNNDLDSLEIPEARFAALTNSAVAAKFDLSVIARMDQQRLDFSWTYDAEIFNKERIECLSDDLCRLLERIVQTPDAPLASLPVMDDARIAELTHALQGKSAALDETDTLALRFERQAQATPTRCALVFGERRIDYQKLNQDANRVAHYLLAQNFAPMSIIGVCGEKSPATIATLFGVMKSGLAFVMLDPMYPAARLQHMAKDAAIACLVHTDESAAELGLVQGLTQGQLSVDYFCEAVQQQSAQNPSAQQGSELAYLAYTSGSTGQPKGVRSRKVAVLNYLDYLSDSFAIGGEDTCLQLASLAFDASIRDTFAPLTQGACVVLADKQTARDPNALRELIKRHQVTVIPAIVPSVLTELVSCDGPMANNLRLILTSGEPLMMALCQQTRAAFGKQVQLVNQYGPTETTMTACFHRVDFDQDTNAMVPVGKALQNLSLYLLDDELQMVPQGCIAELYIGGVGLADGYHQLAELSQKAFIDNPFGPGKLYRSGDLLSLDSDGVLHFVGRVDNQVKLRGLRIELGEIESALSAIAGIELAAAGVGANQTLVAWYQGRNIEQGALKAILSSTLADYMVPQLFIHLDKLPLTANGKIDRGQLPQPTDAELYGQYQAPEGRFEQQLASIWAELLAVDGHRIGRDSDFFALGGHSLLAVRLSSQIRKQFDCELPVAAVFSHAGLAQLAQQIESCTQSLTRPAITAQNIAQEQSLPCSFAQQRLWFIDQLQGQSREYNMPIAFEVSGELDIDKAQQALNLIIKRHSVLRTVYVTVDGEPQQQLLANASFQIDVQDVAALDEAEVLALIDRDSKRDFNLSSDLIIRGSYFKGADRNWLLVNMHHIASDAWSMMVLLREFRQAYSALVQGKTPALEPLTLQYSDYALWQRQWLKGEVLQTQLDYWQQQLAHAPVVHDLPLKGARPEHKQHLGDSLLCHAPAGLAQALNHFAISRQLTPFMALHSAFALVLSRHSNSRDIVIGTPVANRLQAELEPLIGFFVNTLVLRASTDFDSLDEYLAHIKALNLAAQSHQDISFEQLVEHCQVPRSNAHTPLFQIMLTLNNVQSGGSLQLPGAEFKALAPKTRVVKYDIELIVRFDDNQLQWEWLYDVALFDAQYIAMLNQHFERVLQTLLKGAVSSLQHIEILSDNERADIFALNQTAKPLAQDVLVHHGFERFAQHSPDHCAVIFDDKQLSYGELEQKANQLANYLVAQGCLPAQGCKTESLIAIEMERSLEMVVAILAILKAGGAYVPLDPELPVERRKFIIADTKAELVLCTAGNDKELAGDVTYLPIDLTAQGPWQQCSTQAPTVAGCNWHNAAYVIYTSGSTGQPKGVVNEHRALVNRIKWMQDAYGLNADDKVMQKTPYGFDVSVWEFLWTLGYGATLVMAKPQGHKDPQYLSELMAKHQVSVMHFVPSMLVAYRHSGCAIAPSLRLLLCSGEALGASEVQWLSQKAPWTSLHNLYGPTEAAIDVSHFACAELGERTQVPIGKPIDNIQLLVLDNQLNLCPVGVAGELHIGGIGLARGYLNRPELTDKQFIANPFAEHFDPSCQSAKLYKTGDLVRLCADGNLAYLGRIDRQVKLRGLRIELGEIEAQLALVTGIDNCAVMVREDVPGEQVLVAYVVAENFNQAVTVTALAKVLPQYMVPAVYVELEALPLSVNGKVDVKALPAPAAQSVDIADHQALPVEALQLAKIWSALLGVELEAIGENSDFFALGGHSLLAVRLVARVREQLKKHCDLALVFANSRLGDLSRALTQPLEYSVEIQAIESASEQWLPTSYAQQQLWFIDKMQGGSAEYHMPAELAVEGELDIDGAQQAVRAIIDAHQVLRSRYRLKDQQLQQQVMVDFDFAVSEFDLQALDGAAKTERLAQIVQQQREKRFSLDGDVAIRVALVKLAPMRQQLLFNMHHIASDGWSINLVVEAFSKLYGQWIAGERNLTLAPPKVQYADYARWQREQLKGEALEEHLQYWCEYLKDVSPLHGLKTDKPRPARQSRIGEQFELAISGELYQQLKTYCAEHQVTLFMVLQSVYAAVLWRAGESDDILFGTPQAGRQSAQCEGVIGNFVNTTVIRRRFDEQVSFSALLATAKADLLDSYPHQVMPFDLLVEKLNPERRLDYNPLIQLWFVMQNQPADELKLTGLKLAGIKPDKVNAQFDIQLSAFEANGQLYLKWTWASDLFERTTLLHISECFETMLKAALAEPDRPLAQLAIPSKADILNRQQQQTKSKVRSKRFVRKAPGTAKGAI